MRRTIYLTIILLAVVCPVFAQNVTTNPPRFNPPGNDVTVTGTATLVCPLNLNRTFCNVTIGDDSAVRWGDSTVTTSRGQRIKAGASIQIPSRDAVYMITEDVSVVATITEEVR